MEDKETIVKNYVNAYNNFDVNGMMADMDQSIVFENVADGKVNMALNGLDEFKAQAGQWKNLFSSRQQTIKGFTHTNEQTEIEIAYHAILAIDLPNGMKKGDELNLRGRSIFKFSGDKIVGITDIS
ncbi:nuclear transport factor 2 family protein [Mucilaginibacter aquariorum]|uniref:Nuclear transport factor 2 family protein n=1 Tax=Mucilaginibacter aquariorum TaxID=2967225 RepID=A0ABT1T786_9SPHI|nr:nuclear transport factor 2 family protein [Mucilaginibacter aquariorum]MCQ6960462.1 nuclear transport factor 2 family protein [Mucilaginibacter aquariorum]